MGNPLTDCQKKLAKIEKAQDSKTIRFLQLEAENKRMHAEIEAIKTRADATWNMYLGILMQAGTIGEARRWTATIYAELCDLCEKPHTKQDVTDLLERNGLNMRIQVKEIGLDEQGPIFDMIRMSN